jgi:hypothetical protein
MRNQEDVHVVLGHEDRWVDVAVQHRLTAVGTTPSATRG